MADTRVYVIMRRGANYARIVAYSRDFLEALQIAEKLSSVLGNTLLAGEKGYSVEEAHELFLRDLEV